MRQDNRTAAQEAGGFALNAMVHGRESAAWVWGMAAAHFGAKVAAERAMWARIQKAIDELPWCKVCRDHHLPGPLACLDPFRPEPQL